MTLEECITAAKAISAETIAKNVSQEVWDAYDKVWKEGVRLLMARDNITEIQATGEFYKLLKGGDAQPK